MVARKKTKKIKIRSGSTKRRKRQTPLWSGPNLKELLKALSFVSVILVAVAFFYLADQYMRNSIPAKTGPIKLINVPAWVNNQLIEKIFADMGGKTIELNENVAGDVYEKLISSAWISDVNVLTTDTSIQIEADFRKPIAVVKSGLSRFYVDQDQVVLDYVPMPHLMLVEIKGLSLVTDTLHYGQPWEREDLDMAIKILTSIMRRDMENSSASGSSLLSELASIDVSNFMGKEDRNQPHIILYAKDNTTIIWGAEMGQWQKYMESSDEQKLAKLFNYYTEKGSLMGGDVKYINLRNPLDNVPLPIDRY